MAGFYNVLFCVFIYSLVTPTQCSVLDPCYFWEGATYVNGKCIQPVNKMLSWPDAQAYCEGQWTNGTLLEIRSDTEWDVILSIQKQLNSHFYFLGATDIKSEAIFVWTSDNSIFVPADSWWGIRQPDNNLNKEHCLVLNDEGLNDASCNHPVRFMCQYELQVDPCYFWRDAVYANGKCFKKFNNKLTWADAQDVCEKEMYGGSLAEMITEAEKTVVVTILSGDGVWLGATDHRHENTFEWTLTKDPVNDKWWADGQPENSTDESCLSFNKLGLRDQDCGRLKAFVCHQAIQFPPGTTDPCYHLKGGTYLLTKCVKLYDTPMSWNEAQAFCEKISPSGTLLELTSDLEKKALGTFHRDSSNKVWVGASDLTLPGTFQWSQSRTVVNPIWWLRNEPSSREGEDCVQMGTYWGLDDVNCSLVLPFYCQEAIHNPCDVFLPGGDFFQGRCFLYVNTELSFKDAEKNCSERGNAFLVEPSTRELDMYVSGLALRYPNQSVWLGAVANSTSWTWLASGEPILNSQWRIVAQSEKGAKLVLEGGTSKFRSVTTAQLPFICQADIGNPCENDLPGAIYSTGYCLKYFDTPMNWTEAQVFCSDKESYLAEPTTEVLATALKQYLKSIDDEPKTILIGVAFNTDDMSYRWESNGGDVDYSNWTTTANSPLGNYGTFEDTGVWQAQDGSQKNTFICQKRPTGITVKCHRYMAVVPNLNKVNDNQTTYIHVTSGYTTHNVYLRIKTSTRRRQSVVTRTYVSPSKGLKFYLNSEHFLDLNGISSKYVELCAFQPVTVVLYVMSDTPNMLSSTLIYQGVMFIPFSSPRSNFLIAGSHRNETALTITTVDESSTQVSVTLAKHSIQESEITVGGITLSPVSMLTASIGFKYTSLNIDHGLDMNGAYVRSSQGVTVFLGEAGNSESDSTLERLLPIEFLGSVYVTFPSWPIQSDDRDFFKIVAVNESTVIEVHKPADLGGQMTLTLDSPGDVMELNLPRKYFYLITGNKNFYAFKTSGSKTSNPRGACLTSLLHNQFWRHQYDVEITSEFNNRQIFIAVIVSTNFVSELSSGFDDVMLTDCAVIEGSPWTGCFYQLPSNQLGRYYHIKMSNHQERFGAYMYSTNRDGVSAMCHSLGIRYHIPQSNTFDHDAYVDSLVEPLTTQADCETTTGPTTPLDIVTTDSSTTESVTISTASLPTNVSTSSSNSQNVTTSPPIVMMETPQTDGHPYGISEDLSINAKCTSAFKRKLYSVTDKRISSRTIGVGGVLFLVLVFGLLIYNDIMTAVQNRGVRALRHR